jgi:nitrogen fixation protein NifZ
LSIRGEVVVPAGNEGEIFKVLRDLPDGVQYHVHFLGGRMLQVPETLLDAVPDSLPDAPPNTTPEQAHA